MVHRVIVIGAGMAGLAAATSLRDAGWQVCVVERETQVGGRVHSAAFHGRVIECGAQFPSTGYRHMPALLERAGLATQAVPTSPWAAFERDGRLHRVHPNRPATLVGGGLLRWHEALRLALGTAPSLRRTRRLDASSYAAFAALDDEDADDWCRRACGHAAASRFFEPMVHGLYFHPLRGASRALLEALMTFRSAQTLAVRGGWQALPRRMARGLDVRTGCHVESLVQTPHGVRARVGGDRIDADWAVLATPAPAARSLVLDPTPEEAAVLDAGYARAMHVALGMHADWPLPPELRGMHGLIFGPHRHDGAPTLVASMVVESERLAQEGPPVLCAMLGDTAALRHAASSDETVAREVAQWLDTHWPGASARVTDHRIQRWSEAEPLSPAGRARAAQHYRRQWSPARRIILCGDHLGLPWTDGAVETGLWAAHRLEVWAADTFLPG
ncbi:MAG: hypothetical protein ABS84_13645 [Rubrivivax sp. SCN 71-131]|jgi:oxygen-dependent protoporphyrinogen oxidase|nr:MAG: hypothetical protein ABS84_13645 [Rubrivivax sp. SCN 71-131]